MTERARCTVTEKREPIIYAQQDDPRLNLEVSWDSGDEDRCLAFLQQAYDSAVTQINAARPVAASTPQEGTTP